MEELAITAVLYQGRKVIAIAIRKGYQSLVKGRQIESKLHFGKIKNYI